jgi:hypothetical protein
MPELSLLDRIEALDEAPAPNPAGPAAISEPDLAAPVSAVPLPEPVPVPAPETGFQVSGTAGNLFNFTAQGQEKITWAFSVQDRPRWSVTSTLVAPVVSAQLRKSLEDAEAMKNARDLLARQRAAAKEVGIAQAKVREQEARREVLVAEAPADLARQLLDLDAELTRLRQEAGQREEEAAVLVPLAQQASQRLRQFAEGEWKRLFHQRVEELRQDLREGLQAILDKNREELAHALTVMLALRNSSMDDEGQVRQALAALEQQEQRP